MGHKVEIDSIETVIGLRKLRAFHWLKMLHYRSRVQIALKAGWVNTAQRLDERANMHTKFVQSLNDVFQDLTTGESDAAEYGWTL